MPDAETGNPMTDIEISENDRRQWPRHDFQIPVSVKCTTDPLGEKTWYIGETLNLSVDGMAISICPLPDIRLASTVKIICFPEKPPVSACMPEPEPVWVIGRIVWVDADRHCFGIEILT